MKSYYKQVETRFGKPEVRVFSPTEYRVSIPGPTHYHGGACSGPLFADGRNLEAACKTLLAFVEKPHVEVVNTRCDYRCDAGYAKSGKWKLDGGIREILKQVDRNRVPYWKRSLPPCADERCSGEHGHDGKHWAAKPVEYDEW